ncbi:MAG TPA: hypothetical protein VD948_06175 [Rhodothermales bacterium]|nr:hypothetical protein [Rhodothermales bacterium]
MTRAATRATLMWPLLVILFMLAGGLGAGLTGGLFEVITDDELDNTFYAVTFAACGYIAVKLAFGVVEAERERRKHA